MDKRFKFINILSLLIGILVSIEILQPGLVCYFLVSFLFY